MSESADVTATLLMQLSKLVRSLSDDDMKRVASGELKPTLLSPGHRIVEATAAAVHALKAVSQLTADQVQQLEDRHGKLVFVPKGAKISYPLDFVEMVAEVARLETQEEVVRYLDADSRLNPATLKKLAAEMNIEVPANIKAKPQLQLHIAERAIRDRGRWNWR